MKNQRNLSGNFKLKVLNRYLEFEGNIRKEDRLEDRLTYERKMFPDNHKFSEIIFKYFPQEFFHLGAQSLLHHVRESYWLNNGRSLPSKIIHKCVTCLRKKTHRSKSNYGKFDRRKSKH